MNFHPSTALHCARLVSDLYDGRIAPSIVCAASDTQVRVEVYEQITYVIFPGTASIQDWLTDVRIAKSDWFAGRSGRVHAGFKGAYQSVSSDIADALHKACNVIIAGHSLGGALATLCAHDLVTSRIVQPAEVYTFGSPRVGNWTFASDYNAKLHDQTFRVVNQRDPVPAVPFVCGTYKHAGTEVYLPDAGGTTIDHPMWTAITERVQSLASTAQSPACDFVSVGAHKIPAYIVKLGALEK